MGTRPTRSTYGYSATADSFGVRDAGTDRRPGELVPPARSSPLPCSSATGRPTGGSSGSASLAVIAAVVLAWAGPVPVPRPLRASPRSALLGALTLWVGLTMWWSIAPDLSWAAFDRLLAYCAFALLGLLACRVERPARTVAAGLAVLVGLVLAWALLGKVIPSLFPDGARVARLRNPVGYWNSLALVAATAMPLGLWGASRRHSREARAAGAVLVYLAELVVVLTYSRAGIAVAALAALAWVAVERDRLEALLTLVLVTPVAALVALWAFSRPAITDDLQTYADRVNDGAWFGVLAFAGLALVGIGAWLAAGVELPEERTAGSHAASRRDRRHRRRRCARPRPRAQGRSDPRRVPGLEGTRSPSPRTASPTSAPATAGRWWKESWQLWQDAPLGGKGAGRSRSPGATSGRLDRHHRAARPAAPVPGRDRDRRLPAAARPDRGRRDGRRLRGAEGRGARARARPARSRSALGAFALHSLVEIHWEFVAVTAPAFFVLGVLVGLGARRSARPPRGRPVAATVVAARRALLADRAVRVEPPRRLGIRGHRPRRRPGCGLRRTLGPVAEPALDRPAARARRRRVGPAGRGGRARRTTARRCDSSRRTRAPGTRSARSSSSPGATATPCTTSTGPMASTRTAPRVARAACSTRPGRKWRAR